MYDLSVFELDEGIEHYDFWLLNTYTGVLTPMSLASYVDQHRHGCQYGAEMLPFPRNAAVDFRAKDGMIWLCVNRVEPEDIPEREGRYRNRILRFIEDYDTVWGEVVAEMMGRYEQLRSVDPDRLGNFELVLHFEDAWQVRGRMWDLHYLMMNGIFGLYVLFEQQCKELLGVDDRDPVFHALLRGFDNEKFQADRGLWQLAQRAFDLDLAEVMLERPRWNTGGARRDSGRTRVARGTGRVSGRVRLARELDLRVRGHTLGDRPHTGPALRAAVRAPRADVAV